ncbi:GAK9 protein, partial [Chaetorhynchus papuensis]|nr:GAK9 protein [Chaetorhynchus papuensis]
MERQAALTLFTQFLRQRGVKEIDLHKDLPGLVDYGISKGCFTNPNTIHELSEGRKFGDLIWEAVLDDDKTAKKLGKQWRVVHNTLLQHTLELKAAKSAHEANAKNQSYVEDQGANPPSFTSFTVPTAALGTSIVPPAPSAPEAELPAPPAERALTPPPVEESSCSADLRDQLRQRAECWAKVVADRMQQGDGQAVEALGNAFPVTFQRIDDNNVQVTLHPLDWKILMQLRATVTESGLQGEPTKQMLDYIFDSNTLLPAECRSIMKLICTPSQQLLCSAHWQGQAQETVAVQRQPGDPLFGITLEALLGLGVYHSTEAQAGLGPDRLKEAMRVFRKALSLVRDQGGMPTYMSIKQGVEEPLGSFVDRLVSAIQKAGVPDYMKGIMLKQCVQQNGNSKIRSLISNMGGHWTIEELLERAANLPQGQTAFMVQAFKELEKELGGQLRESVRQGQEASVQAMAALAPLQSNAQPLGTSVCYRCGNKGHTCRECRTRSVWCNNCNSGTHSTTACRRKFGGSGNGGTSARCEGRARTQVAVAHSVRPAKETPIHHQSYQGNYAQPPSGASGWTWQPQ